MDFSFVVPSEQEQQLREDTVGPGIAVVDVERRLYMSHRLVSDVMSVISRNTLQTWVQATFAWARA